MNKEKVISNYLEATESILTSFRFNRRPDVNSVNIVTCKTIQFISALREIYFSESKEKNNHYEVIYNIISKATFHIQRENFGPGAFSDTWNTIVYSLEFVERHVQELHFKESNVIYPFPNDKIELSITEPTEKQKPEQETPKTFEELFYNPAHAEPCLKILNELQPPVIDAINNYIGKGKGIFPLWIKVLKSHEPKPLIKHFKNTIYKDLLNRKIKGLNLSKDASEFRKHYKRIEKDKVELDIKAILSQYSQSGKLGK